MHVVVLTVGENTNSCVEWFTDTFASLTERLYPGREFVVHFDVARHRSLISHAEYRNAWVSRPTKPGEFTIFMMEVEGRPPPKE
jgi:hypothetical protein